MLSFIEPLTSLNFGTFICAKERIKTKKAINRVAMSANVAIQAGAPPLHGGQSSSGASSTSLTTLATAMLELSGEASEESLLSVASPSGASTGSVTPFSSESSAIVLRHNSSTRHQQLPLFGDCASAHSEFHWCPKVGYLQTQQSVCCQPRESMTSTNNLQ